MAKKSGYILGNVIARGGMAEIFLGKAVGDGQFHRLCAVKRILPHYSGDKEFVRMFKDEASICQGLHHANIVQVYDFKKLDDSYALIMEYVEGADLRTSLSNCEKNKTRLTVPMIVYTIAEAARGLHYAHTKLDEETHQPLGIIHRDISPQNILISFEGEVKITDFGIADADHRETETKPGVVKGKYSYMSPEQVNAKKLDARTDIFSLAIILWEALAMRRLFAGQNEVETIKRVQSAEIRHNLQEINPKVDNKLMRIIMKGLQPDRKKRFQSAKEFEKELLKYLHSYFPDFNSAELSSFMKTLFSDKRKKIKNDIKDLLSKTQQAVGTPSEIADPNPSADAGADGDGDSAAASSTNKGIKKLKDGKIEIDLDEKSGSQKMEIGIGSIPHPNTSMTKIPQFTRGVGETRTGTVRDQDPYGSELRYSIRAKHKRKSSDSGLNRNLLISALLIVFVVIAGFVYKDISQIPAESATVQLDGPQRVLLMLNNQLLFKGRYRKLPVKFTLKPGQYQLKVLRQGHKTRAYNIRVNESGESLKKNVFLERDPSVQSKPVKISVRGVPRVSIDLDNGFIVQEINENNPIFIQRDLIQGKHKLVVKRPGGKTAWLCAFETKGSPNAATHILIQPQGNRLTCKYVK